MMVSYQVSWRSKLENREEGIGNSEIVADAMCPEVLKDIKGVDYDLSWAHSQLFPGLYSNS